MGIFWMCRTKVFLQRIFAIHESRAAFTSSVIRNTALPFISIIIYSTPTHTHTQSKWNVINGACVCVRSLCWFHTRKIKNHIPSIKRPEQNLSEISWIHWLWWPLMFTIFSPFAYLLRVHRPIVFTINVIIYIYLDFCGRKITCVIIPNPPILFTICL